MKRQFNFYTRTNQIIIDGTLFAFSLAAAYLFRFEGVLSWPWMKQYLLWLPYLLAARLLINWKLGIYRFVWRYVSLSDALLIARSLLIPTAGLLALRLLYPEKASFSPWVKLPISVIALEFLLSLVGSLGARAARRILYEQQRKHIHAENPTTTLLIGAGRTGAMVAKDLAANTNINLIGFLDDDLKKVGCLISGLPVLGPTSSLQSVVQEHAVQEVITCIPQPPRVLLRTLWALCDSVRVPLRIVPTLDEIMHGNVNIAAIREVRITDLLGRETLEAFSNGSAVASAYQNKRILITGAGGSIGSELARQLAKLSPRQLVLLDKDENGLSDVYWQFGAQLDDIEVHPVIADIRSPERLQSIFSRFRPEVVFHAAAHKHVPLMEMNPSEAILNNVVGTHNLVKQSLGSGTSRFVLISTDKAVKPVSVMGATKRVCEMILEAYSDRGPTCFSGVRFGNVIGSRGSVVPLFQKQIARGEPIAVTHPEMQRYLMTIPEAVRLVIEAGTMGSGGEMFVLNIGVPVSILNMARELIEHSGLRPERDIPIKITQLRPGEKIREELIDGDRETLSATCSENIGLVKGPSFNPAAFFEALTRLEDAARQEATQEIHEVFRNLDIGFEPAPAAPMPPNSEIR